MRFWLLGLTAMISGFVLLIIGGAKYGVFLIFPFIVSTGPFGFIGILLIFSGFILVFLGIPSSEPENGIINLKKRGIGIVMIGPIPLVIDTDNKKLTLISIGIFLTVLLILIFLYLGAIA